MSPPSRSTIPLKAWVIDEAARSGVKPITIYHRMMRGKYPWLPLIRLNKRRVYVEIDKQFDWMGEGPMTEGR